jgi:arsenate reductase (thioredoxin)
MSEPARRPWRVLFLCTGNSARSQIAEALLNRKGAGRFVAESAGSHPAARVNPNAIAALAERGIAWGGRPPRPIDEVAGLPWDLVITVCDRAREACPVLPGQPVQAHWGMPDPAEVVGDETGVRRAFEETIVLLSRRIDLLLNLPVEKLERLVLEQRVRALGQVGAEPESSSSTSPGDSSPAERSAGQ